MSTDTSPVAPLSRNQVFAVVGGTGALGSGLVHRLCRAGFQVVVGSRDAQRARDYAQSLQHELPGARASGASNAEAAAAADIVVVAVPFASQAETLAGIATAVQGKIVIDTSVCLRPPKVGTVHVPPEGSACMQSQARLGPAVRVVSAFQNISAEHLHDPAYDNCDILVCSDDDEARAFVATLVSELGLRGWQAGPLANSVAVEGMTSVLITINRKYRIQGGAGIRVSGHA